MVYDMPFDGLEASIQVPDILSHDLHFPDKFRTSGCYLWRSVLARPVLAKLKNALAAAVLQEVRMHRHSDDTSLVACCPWYDDIFLEALRGPIFEAADALLGYSCTLYSYSNSCIKPGEGNFSSRIHTERSYITGEHLELLGMILLLDDFTEENGATWYLPASQQLGSSPDEEWFYANASRLVAPAGSVFFFHPHLWHAGGVNQTAYQRQALSIGFCQPYMKQRIDLVSLFSARRDEFPDDIRQKLGFNAKPPSSITEFYQRKGGW